MSEPERRLLSKAIFRPSERHRGRQSVFGGLVMLVGFTSVPVGSKVKISKLPVRLVAQAILPLMPGKAAPAGETDDTTPEGAMAMVASTSPAFFLPPIVDMAAHLPLASARYPNRVLLREYG